MLRNGGIIKVTFMAANEFLRVEEARDVVVNRKFIFVQIVWGKEVKPLLEQC